MFFVIIKGIVFPVVGGLVLAAGLCILGEWLLSLFGGGKGTGLTYKSSDGPLSKSDKADLMAWYSTYH